MVSTKMNHGFTQVDRQSSSEENTTPTYGDENTTKGSFVDTPPLGSLGQSINGSEEEGFTDINREEFPSYDDAVKKYLLSDNIQACLSMLTPLQQDEIIKKCLLTKNVHEHLDMLSGSTQYEAVKNNLLTNNMQAYVATLPARLQEEAVKKCLITNYIQNYLAELPAGQKDEAVKKYLQAKNWEAYLAILPTKLQEEVMKLLTNCRQSFRLLPRGQLNDDSRECTPESTLFSGSKRGPFKGRRSIHTNNENGSTSQNKMDFSNIIVEYKDKISETVKNYKLFFSVAVIAVLCGIFSVFYGSDPPDLNDHRYIKEKVLKEYTLQNKRDLMNLFYVIDELNEGKYEKDKVAVITILYSHRETAECLAKSTADYAVKVFNRSSGFAHLNGSLSNDNFGLGNKDFKKDIEDKRVLVVFNLHDFPAEKVRHFHGICDKHTPYIEDKAVYIILLELSQNQEKVSKALEKVRSRLYELWSSLKSNVLDPLVSRFADNTMVVRQESQLLC